MQCEEWHGQREKSNENKAFFLLLRHHFQNHILSTASTFSGHALTIEFVLMQGILKFVQFVIGNVIVAYKTPC